MRFPLNLSIQSPLGRRVSMWSIDQFRTKKLHMFMAVIFHQQMYWLRTKYRLNLFIFFLNFCKFIFYIILKVFLVVLGVIVGFIVKFNFNIIIIAFAHVVYLFYRCKYLREAILYYWLKYYEACYCYCY